LAQWREETVGIRVVTTVGAIATGETDDRQKQTLRASGSTFSYKYLPSWERDFHQDADRDVFTFVGGGRGGPDEAGDAGSPQMLDTLSLRHD
jgi:hypothetical protein